MNAGQWAARLAIVGLRTLLERVEARSIRSSTELAGKTAFEAPVVDVAVQKVAVDLRISIQRGHEAARDSEDPRPSLESMVDRLVVVRRPHDVWCKRCERLEKSIDVRGG